MHESVVTTRQPDKVVSQRDYSMSSPNRCRALLLLTQGTGCIQSLISCRPRYVIESWVRPRFIRRSLGRSELDVRPSMTPKGFPLFPRYFTADELDL